MTMKHSKTLRRARAISAGATALFSGCLLAAETQTGATSNESDTRGAVLEEIVVTAEKRAEGLQNIPIAITAVASKTITRFQT